MTILALSKPTASPRFIEKMVILVAVLGTGMLNIDITAINVALPSIQVALAADIRDIQWLIDIFILTLAALVLVGGMLGDRYGRVRIVAIGSLVFSLASLAAGLAQSLQVLLAMRAIQGIGGALLAPSGLALINATVPLERRGRVIGLWATLATMIIACGPSLGGWLVDQVSWRAVFLINLPLGLLACSVALRYIPESRDKTAGGPLDWPGAVALIIGLGGLLFGIIEGPHLGWTHRLTLGMLGGSGLGLGAFLLIERYSPTPMLPLHLFRNRSFSGINLLTICYFMAFGGTLLFLTLNLQQIQGFSALAAGLAVLPITLSILVMSTPMGRLTDRFGSRPLLLIGLVISGGGYLLLARLGVESAYWRSFFPATLVFGVGMGIMIVPLTIQALTALPDRFSGIASGTNYAATRLGNMFAIALFGSLMVVSFQAGLAEQVADLPLTANEHTQLMTQARNLGATKPPPNLAPEITEATQTAIELAFVASFRQVMLLCAGLMGAGLGIVLVFIHRRM